jgi:hypothetical protein
MFFLFYHSPPPKILTPMANKATEIESGAAAAFIGKDILTGGTVGGVILLTSFEPGQTTRFKTRQLAGQRRRDMGYAVVAVKNCQSDCPLL